jgi:hypothetical protein
MDRAKRDYPTVIEGRVRDGKLEIVVHDVLKNTIAGSFQFQ